jgi:hypothetical protein
MKSLLALCSVLAQPRMKGCGIAVNLKGSLNQDRRPLRFFNTAAPNA